MIILAGPWPAWVLRAGRAEWTPNDDDHDDAFADDDADADDDDDAPPTHPERMISELN